MFHQWSYDHVLCIIYLNHFEVWHDTRFHFTLDYPKQESWSIPKRKAPAGKDCCLLSPKLKARPAQFSFKRPLEMDRKVQTDDISVFTLRNCLLFENRPKRLKSSMCSTIHSKAGYIPQVLLLALLLAVAHAEVQLYKKENVKTIISLN